MCKIDQKESLCRKSPLKTQVWIAIFVYVLDAKATQPRSKPLQHSPASECCALDKTSILRAFSAFESEAEKVRSGN